MSLNAEFDWQKFADALVIGRRSEPMQNIVIVHYHLRRGGVTRVIETAVKALRGKANIVIFSGEDSVEEIAGTTVIVQPALTYRSEGNPTVASGLAEALLDAAREHFGTDPDLWHFHNHSLGKNVLLPPAIRELAGQKQRILLQLHDFPEDGRPQNYALQRSSFENIERFEEALYPTARHIHYATINSRDYRFLSRAGVDPDRLHLLPNAVLPISVETKPTDRPFSRDKKWVLYPTRGIRRKNIGELLLLAFLNRQEFDFATTLSPENPEWQSTHEQWREVAERLAIPVKLGISDSGEWQFSDLIGWADCLVTTSIAEGFGLAFLEPWVSGKSVFGRRLERITRDFSEKEIDLGHMYERLEIPVSWIDQAELDQAMDGVLRQTYLAYDRVLPDGAVEQAKQVWIKDGYIDFGVLSEPFQISVLEKLAEQPDLCEEVKAPKIDPMSAEEIAARSAPVARHFSIDSYGGKLETIYRRVGKSRISRRIRHLNPGKVLDEFLSPARLNLLRT